MGLDRCFFSGGAEGLDCCGSLFSSAQLLGRRLRGPAVSRANAVAAACAASENEMNVVPSAELTSCLTGLLLLPSWS